MRSSEVKTSCLGYVLLTFATDNERQVTDLSQDLDLYHAATSLQQQEGLDMHACGMNMWNNLCSIWSFDGLEIVQGSLIVIVMVILVAHYHSFCYFLIARCQSCLSVVFVRVEVI